MSRQNDANFYPVAVPVSGRGNGIVVPLDERAKVRPNLIYKRTRMQLRATDHEKKFLHCQQIT